MLRIIGFLFLQLVSFIAIFSTPNYELIPSLIALALHILSWRVLFMSKRKGYRR